MNELLTYAIMLDLLVVDCVWSVIMLIDLQEVQSQELKCLHSKTAPVLSE